MKKALILGITGQDGSYLSELLLKEGYEVHGVVRRASTINTSRIDHMFDPESKAFIHFGDLSEGIDSLLYNIQPDEVYNLGAMSHVRVSFDQPVYTGDINALGVTRVLEALRKLDMKKTRYYQASSCLPAGTKVLVKQLLKRKRNGKFNTFAYLGVKNIEELMVGEEVLSMNLKTSKKEYKKIEAIGNRFAKDMYTVHFSNGNSLRLSGNHPLYIVGKGWVRADKVKIGQECIQKKYAGLQSLKMKGKTNKEIYGNKRAKEISTLASQSHIGITNPMKGKKYPIGHPIRDKNPKKAHESWNTGLTKNSSSKLKSIGEKISLSNKRNFCNQEFRDKFFKKTRNTKTKLESIFENILIGNFKDEFRYNDIFDKLNKVKIGGYYPDFINNKGKKKIIELYGNYYHASPKKYKATDLILTNSAKSIWEKDKKRIKVFKKSGFEVLVIWEDELKDVASLCNKIKTFIHNPSVDIVSITSIKREMPEKVFDIQVEDNHNFFAKGILVHNSEMFGISPAPQNENTPMLPVSPYGIAKLYAYHMTRAYRTGYHMFASNGILFNHESERRGETFVTRKITKAACRIKLGLQGKIILGNLSALRDWGHSADYMACIHKILQHDVPDDFVVATGFYHTVEEFLKEVFEYLDMDYTKHLIYSSHYERPNEVPELRGDSSKSRKVLNWEPKIMFKDLVKLMVDNDMKEAQRELMIKDMI